MCCSVSVGVGVKLIILSKRRSRRINIEQKGLQERERESNNIKKKSALLAFR